MNIDNLGLIEKELIITLPDSYKNIMINYPFKGHEFDFIKRNLIDDSQAIIKLNLDVRKNGYQNKDWPNNYFIIGNVDCNLYFINSSEANSPIYFLTDEDKFNPKNIKKLLCSYNFEEFIEKMKVFQKIHNNP